MASTNPLNKSKKELDAIVAKIQSHESPVGIDVQYTHAIIIDYLQEITKRLDALEKN